MMFTCVVEEIAERDKPGSPAKSDTLRSTDSASGGDTLEEHSSKEVSYVCCLKHLLQFHIHTHLQTLLIINLLNLYCFIQMP